MFKLLFLLSVIKLYARNDIFKDINIVHIEPILFKTGRKKI